MTSVSRAPIRDVPGPGSYARQPRTGTPSGRCSFGTNGAEINIERVRQRVRSGTGHDVPLPEITRRWSAAQTNLCRNGCVARGDRRARQQPRRDQARRTHHEGRNHVTGDANARVGANVDPTDRTAPTDRLTRTRRSDEEWCPYRTLRVMRNSFAINNLQAQRNFRYPFHSQFRLGLNHTLQVPPETTTDGWRTGAGDRKMPPRRVGASANRQFAAAPDH